MVKKNCKLIKFFKYFIKAMRGITVILDWSRAIQSPESRWPKSFTTSAASINLIASNSCGCVNPSLGFAD